MRIRAFSLWLLLSLVLRSAFAFPPQSQPTSAPSSGQLDSILEPIRLKYNLPALAGLILDGDRVSARGAVGVRKQGGDAKVTLDDKWHIGSDTKSMTATLLAILIEQRKLQWTTTLADIFPDLKEKMHADYRGVTLEQLVTHRGGVPADLQADGLWGRLWMHAGTPTEARRVLLEGVITKAPEAKPGTKFIYSNAGYAIAGHVAETVMNEPWESLMQRLLFQPLGITSAGFGAPGNGKKMDQPWGHTGLGGKFNPVRPGKQADNPVAIGPAGIVHISLDDWAKYAAFHLRGDRSAGRLLTAESFTKLHTPPEGGDYAAGWAVMQRPWGGGRVLMHNGSNTMWYAVVWIAPEKDFAVLIATNAGGDAAAKACDEAAGVLILEHQQRTSGRAAAAATTTQRTAVAAAPPQRPAATQPAADDRAENP